MNTPSSKTQDATDAVIVMALAVIIISLIWIMAGLFSARDPIQPSGPVLSPSQPNLILVRMDDIVQAA